MNGRKNIRSLSAEILSLSGKCSKREASTKALKASPMVHCWRFLIRFFGAPYFSKSDLRALPTFLSQRYNPFGVHNGKKA